MSIDIEKALDSVGDIERERHLFSFDQLKIQSPKQILFLLLTNEACISVTILGPDNRGSALCLGKLITR